MQYQVLALGLPDSLFLFLKEQFAKADAALYLALNMRDTVRLCAEQTFHLVILGTFLQAIHAAYLTALRRISFAPVVLLVGHNTKPETISNSLKHGADLCLLADLSPDLMFSYLLAQLRRYTRYNHYDQPESLNAAPIREGDLMIDPMRYEVQVRGQAVCLRPREFSLLLYFMRNPGFVLTTEQICEHAWGMEAGYNRGCPSLSDSCVRPSSRTPRIQSILRQSIK